MILIELQPWVFVPRTTTSLILWELVNYPHRPVDVGVRLGVRRQAAIMRIKRAAESLSAHPRLAVALYSHVRWRGAVATYIPQRNYLIRQAM
ncbi:hypothetical protein PT2222_50018 [Paraburkholderia tropica]